MQKKTVLWISRHQMTPSQLADLGRIAGGEVCLRQWADTVRDISELREEAAKADIIAAVLPLELMAELLRIADGKPVLQAVSRREPTGTVTTLPDGRTEADFRFVHVCWQRVLRVEVETRRL